MGYEEQDIADEDGVHVKSVSRMLNTICQRISDESKRQWQKWVFIHKMGLKTLRCSVCQEDLPAVEEFFTNRDDSSSGFSHRCKKCDTARK